MYTQKNHFIPRAGALKKGIFLGHAKDGFKSIRKLRDDGGDDKKE